MSLPSALYFRQAGMAAAVLLVLTVLLTWPAASRLADGITDKLDGEVNAWVFDWDRHQLLADPGHLFDANIFYPARYTLAFSENLLGEAALGLPLSGFGCSYIQVYNWLLLIGFFSSALAACGLRLTRGSAARLTTEFLTRVYRRPIPAFRTAPARVSLFTSSRSRMALIRCI